MPRLIRHHALVRDDHVLLRDAKTLADVPDATPVIVPFALWLERRGALIARGDVGVLVAPSDDPGALAPDVALLRIIAVDFPQFTDGRGYSIGRLLRERYRYAGELRAVGDVGRDQLYYLAQCGFDAFVIPDERDAEDALRAFADLSDGYQATAVRTPWFRRRQASESPVAGCPCG
jgi:uncharacterized protein (DUF934 family)